MLSARSAILLLVKQIAGLRDRAVHDYYTLDIEELWQTIQKDLPVLQSALKSTH